nr:hypothetical protein [Tanacetum cinerariifolium]
MVVQNQSQLGEGSTIPTDPHPTPTIIQPLTQPQKKKKPKTPKRKDIQVPQPSDLIDNIADKAIHEELGNSLNRSRTYRLKRLYKVGLTARVESSGNEESLGEDASKQERIDVIDTYEEITLVNVQDDIDKEMFDVNVLDGKELFVAEQEVVKDLNDEVNVVKEVVEVINTAKLIIDVAQVSAAGDIVRTASIPVSTASVATTVSVATTTTATITTVGDITLAQALKEIKSTKPIEKGIDIQELGKSTPTRSSQQS